MKLCCVQRLAAPPAFRHHRSCYNATEGKLISNVKCGGTICVGSKHGESVRSSLTEFTITDFGLFCFLTFAFCLHCQSSELVHASQMYTSWGFSLSRRGGGWHNYSLLTALYISVSPSALCAGDKEIQTNFLWGKIWFVSALLVSKKKSNCIISAETFGFCTAAVDRATSNEDKSQKQQCFSRSSCS